MRWSPSRGVSRHAGGGRRTGREGRTIETFLLRPWADRRAAEEQEKWARANLKSIRRRRNSRSRRRRAATTQIFVAPFLGYAARRAEHPAVLRIAAGHASSLSLSLSVRTSSRALPWSAVQYPAQSLASWRFLHVSDRNSNPAGMIKRRSPINRQRGRA